MGAGKEVRIMGGWDRLDDIRPRVVVGYCVWVVAKEGVWTTW